MSSLRPPFAALCLLLAGFQAQAALEVAVTPSFLCVAPDIPAVFTATLRDSADPDAVLPTEVEWTFETPDGEVVHRSATGTYDADALAKSAPTAWSIQKIRQLRVRARVPGADAEATLVIHPSAGFRGMVPLAGDPFAGPGHQNGRGAEARFWEPSSLVHAEGWPDEDKLDRSFLLVADAGSHVLRLVAEDGAVTTVGGTHGVNGHRDGLLSGALFNRPTFLLVRKWQDEPWEYLVADSGNHCLRRIHFEAPAEGALPVAMVETWAGLPGVAGHFDHLTDARSAVFNAPHGLAEDDEGMLYLADRGNCLIRRINPGTGEVSTLAGLRGVPGTADGDARRARFTDLKGLVFVSEDDALLVVDGNSMRRVDLEGNVATVCGTVHGTGSGTNRNMLGDRGFFNAPWSIGCHRPIGAILLADTGNHTLLDFYGIGPDAAIRPVVGGAAQGSTRFGLLRDESERKVLGAPYATLAAPRNMVASPWQPGDTILIDGTALVRIAEPRFFGQSERPSFQATLATLASRLGVPGPGEDKDTDGPRVGEKVFAAFKACPLLSTELGTLPFMAHLQFLNADGSLAYAAEQVMPRHEDFEVVGLFTQPGTGTMTLTYVDALGYTSSFSRTMNVRPLEATGSAAPGQEESKEEARVPGAGPAPQGDRKRKLPGEEKGEQKDENGARPGAKNPRTGV